MATFFKDIQYAIRSMRKSPGFTAIVALSLGLGIGANSAIFTLVNAVFLKPIPVEEPSRVISIFTTDPKNPGFLPLSYLNYIDYRDKNTVLSGLAAYTDVPIALRTDAAPQQIFGELASGNFFEVLGVKPVLGRAFRPQEDGAPGAHPVVVLSYAFWTRQYGANRGILGQKIILNGYPYVVIGVAPPNFQGVNTFAGPSLWAPIAMHAQLEPLDAYFLTRRFLPLNAVARLKPGVSEVQARAQLQTIGSQLERAYPDDNRGRGITTLGLAASIVNPNNRGNLVNAGKLLMAIVGLVLLIACANIANLLLVRSAARRKEIAIRLSIGASGVRLMQQLLTESILLALLGGAAGLLIAAWGKTVLWSFRPPFLNEGDLSLAVDSHVLLFTLGLSVLTGLLFGLAPALQSLRPDVAAELKERVAQAARGSSWFNLRNALVVSQVAFSFVALIGAGLFLRSMRQAEAVDPGFAAAKVGKLDVNPGGQGYKPERAQLYYRQVVERLQATPGIASASIASSVPLTQTGFLRSVFLDGQDAAPGNRGVLVLANSIGPRYFDTMRIPLVRGRAFLETDGPQSRHVAIVNETMAKKFWRGQDPIGQRFRFYGDQFLTEVIGIAKDNKYNAISEDPVAAAFTSELQTYSPNVSVVFRATADPAASLGTVNKEVQAMDPELLITNVNTMSQLIGRSLWPQRMGASLLAAFGFLALALSAVGIYGVMAYSVAQRTSEIGIRMALGARPRDVFRLVIGQGLALVLIGVALGIAAALALARLVAGLLFEVRPSDFTTFAITSLTLIAVAILASFLPARRATVIDPLLALRAE
jgi:putative ABC transport system permease protein